MKAWFPSQNIVCMDFGFGTIMTSPLSIVEMFVQTACKPPILGKKTGWLHKSSKTKKLSQTNKILLPHFNNYQLNKTFVFFFTSPKVSFCLQLSNSTNKNTKKPPVKFRRPKTTSEVRLRSVAAHPRCLFANKVPSFPVESWLGRWVFSSWGCFKGIDILYMIYDIYIYYM